MKRKTIKKKVKKSVRRAKKAPARKKVPAAVKLPRPIGRVTHFYTSLKVMIAKFSQAVRVGLNIRVKGATTDFVQKIDSMQYDHKPVKTAKKNQQVGIKVKKRVRQGDKIYSAK